LPDSRRTAGLYVPKEWPQIAPAKPGESYTDVAARILSAFAGDAIPADAVRQICREAYAGFAHQSVAPLTQWGPDSWLMELHHGPTLAFKDVAMQLIGRLYDYLLGQSGERLTVVCATSGDTGGAAAAAFAGSAQARLVILHPEGRISPVQRLFMTTTGAPNILNIATSGDFDDAQAIVKQLFADKDFARTVSLSGVNSINWARIAAQSGVLRHQPGATARRAGPLCRAERQHGRRARGLCRGALWLAAGRVRSRLRRQRE
jgi:threonine synthase